MARTELPASIELDRVDTYSCPGCHTPLDLRDCDPLDEIICPDCRAESVVPGRLGSFLILDRLGKGGMGVVYLAMDEGLQRNVALKAIRKEFGHDPESREKFANEAVLAASLNHPNIVRIFAYDDTPGCSFIVMEHIEGASLDDLLKAGEPLDPTFVVQVAIDVARALQEAKARDLTHSDIKPANILVDQDGCAKVVDFGLAHTVRTEAPKRVWGSAYYIAPEKARREPDTHLSDQYSLGVTLWHALAGQRPFRGGTSRDVIRKVLADPVPALTGARPDCPAFLAQIIERMMSKRPGRRYPTYRSLIADLEEMQRRLASRAKPKRARPVLRRLALAASLLPPMLIGAALAMAANTSPNASPLPEPPAQRVTVPVPEAAPLQGLDAAGLTARVN